MPEETNIVGIDVGTTNLKIVVLDRDARVVDQASIRYGVETKPGGVVTQDPKLWWDALDRGFAEIGARTGLGRVRALSHSSQGETLVCCDREGRPLGPAIGWMDTRAVEEADRLAGERDDWYDRVGKPIAAWGSLAKIRWLRRHDPDFYRTPLLSYREIPSG